MKKLIVVSALALLIGGIASYWSVDAVHSKAHVPLKKVQVCHKGEVITVSQNALDAHLMRHDDCQLPACDFANIFSTGDTCTVSNPGAQCDVPNPREDAGGLTPACPEGTF